MPSKGGWQKASKIWIHIYTHMYIAKVCMFVRCCKVVQWALGRIISHLRLVNAFVFLPFGSNLQLHRWMNIKIIGRFLHTQRGSMMSEKKRKKKCKDLKRRISKAKRRAKTMQQQPQPQQQQLRQSLWERDRARGIRCADHETIRIHFTCHRPSPIAIANHLQTRVIKAKIIFLLPAANGIACSNLSSYPVKIQGQLGLWLCCCRCCISV